MVITQICEIMYPKLCEVRSAYLRIYVDLVVQTLVSHAKAVVFANERGSLVRKALKTETAN